MDVLEAISEIKTLTQSREDEVLQKKIAEIEQLVTALWKEKQQALDRAQELETQFTSKLRSIRHDVAQPLTTLQFFLDLLPTVLQQERLVLTNMVNQNYWTNTYNRAQEALKSIPRILKG